jgi:hypothetical protein
MHGIKVLAVVLVVGLLALTGLFLVVPSARPAFVQAWFHTAQGFTPAKSGEDALAKFKKALEARDYEAAALYCAGDYKEWITKAAKDAQELGRTIDDLRSVMKTTGVKSDKADLVLYSLDPFPASFKIDRVAVTGEKGSAVLNWTEDVIKYSAIQQDLSSWKVDVNMSQALLPIRIGLPPSSPVTMLLVEVWQDKDKSWKVVLPVEVNGGRHLRYPIEALLKNGSNFKNGLNELKNEVKRDPGTKDAFENNLRQKLEESK